MQTNEAAFPPDQYRLETAAGFRWTRAGEFLDQLKPDLLSDEPVRQGESARGSPSNYFDCLDWIKDTIHIYWTTEARNNRLIGESHSL